MPATATVADWRSGAIDRARSGRGHGPLLQKPATCGVGKGVPTACINQGARITRRVPAVGAQANRLGARRTRARSAWARCALPAVRSLCPSLARCVCYS